MVIKALTSGLQRRIAEGKADPISDLEREQYERMEQIIIRRFGHQFDARPESKLTA